MSTKFFQSIRRNQRQWMVVVTVLSMVSFLFLDYFGKGKGPMSAFGGGLMVGCLVAAAMSIIGYSRQKTAEFGIGGFLAGFLAGFIGFNALAHNKPVARTSVGSLTRKDFEKMGQQRLRANQFMAAVARKIQGSPASGFGGIDDQSLISFRMLLDDAKKLGIRISDEGVNGFLKQITRNRLTITDFKECLRDARLGESELFDILKDELAVRLAIQLIEPPAFVATAPPQLAQYVQNREPLRYMQQTPQQLWDSFQMLNLKQSLEAVEIPVKDFVGEIGKPSDPELAEFFAKYRNRRWFDDASPGFYQMPRVKLAYFTADFVKFEKSVEPTDDEIREYYEKNKDRYRAPVVKESTAPKLPDGTADSSIGDPSTPEAPATPEEAAKKVAPSVEADASKTPSGDNKPEPKQEPNDPPKEDGAKQDGADKKAAEVPKSESNCGDDEPKSQEKATDETPAEKPSAKANPVETDKPVEPDPEKKELTSGEQPPATHSETPVLAPPKLSNSPESLPEAKFRELDNDLKIEIQGILLRERTLARIGTALDKAYEMMVPLGLEYDTATEDAQKKEKAKLISDRMKEYAVLNQLEYVETPEWDYESLSAESIGMATEGQGRSTVANDVMIRGGEKGEPRMPLYTPRRADLKTKRESFAYWKIHDVPPRIPELTEELVREKAIRAWKFDQARLFAEKRAKALSDKAKADAGNLTAAVAGESSTGHNTDSALSVIETPEFTWLSTPQSVPGAPQDPMTTDIPLIKNAGNDFMKTVFEDLKEGEVGVAANANKSAYYVVKVVGRETAKDDGGVAQQERYKRFLAERFSGLYPIIKSPYEAIAQLPQQAIDQAWRQSFEKRHSVEWEEEVQQQQQQGRRR